MEPNVVTPFMPTIPNCILVPGRDNLDQFEKTYLKKSTSWVGPDVVLLTAPDGVKFVMKDWGARSLLFRGTWCRVAASREIKVYQKLRGMKGVPQLISTLGSHGFVMEWLDARTLPVTKLRDLLGLEFFQDLTETVAEMHSRGVAHGDLRRRNILRGLDGTPKLIDFETAVHAEKSPGGGWLFRAVSTIDNITILKIRARYFPDSVTSEERQLLDEVPWHLAAGRFLRKKIYAPLTKKGYRKRVRQRRNRQKSKSTNDTQN